LCLSHAKAESVPDM